MDKIWRKKWCTALPCVLALAGCAKLEYTKVPTPTQYSNWTDEDQRKADAMTGVRYYLPRPFLHLKESVPVAQRVAFISFHLDPNEGVYVLDMPPNPPTWLARVVPGRISITQALAATLATTRIEGARQQAGTPGEEEEPQGVEAPMPPSTLKASTGFVNQSDPVTGLSDKMDVVYLPDFEEQYVIRAETGLGKAEIETRLRNGWAAEVFSQDLDNSQVVPYVIKQVEQASKAAAGIATTWMPLAVGLPPGTSPATLLELGGIQPGDAARMQAGAVRDAASIAEDVLGQVLLLKIAEVRIAQPGVYPILKPREIKQWLQYGGVVSGADPEGSFEEFLIQANLPWIRPDMVFVPCPPFTVVGFNVTTDVFLAPATDRAVLTVTSTAPSSTATLDEQKMAIMAAMEKRNSRLGVDAPLIRQQNLNVATNLEGNGTIIRVTTPPSAAFVSDEAAIGKWATEVFSPSGTETIKADRIMVTKSEGGQIVTISILVNMADLAGRAKKVQ